jgi:hypothetical protein
MRGRLGTSPEELNMGLGTISSIPLIKIADKEFYVLLVPPTQSSGI